MAYDYTVLAGTQGYQNHARPIALQLAESDGVPVVFFTEGGGGRPGDTDLARRRLRPRVPVVRSLARLSGRVPLVGINADAVSPGTPPFWLLRRHRRPAARTSAWAGWRWSRAEASACGPEDIGPIDVQTANGVVDVVVENGRSVAVAKRYLSYFQGAIGRGPRLIRRYCAR
jgi:acetyl-CoA carboxylase carboxyltransferase component